MTRGTSTLLAFALALAAQPALADPLRTRVEIGPTILTNAPDSLAGSLGYEDARGASASARLMWEGATDAFRYEFHGLLAARQGDLAGLAALEGGGPPATLFDLSENLIEDDDMLLVGSIDRASLSFSTDTLVVKVGRQAITWGSGLVFHPSDIVAPFPPNAIDTSYKPGADMIYGQLLFDDGADLQAIALPRPEVPGGRAVASASTGAMLFSTRLGPLDGRFLAGRDRGDEVFGIGLSGPLGGMSWTAETVWRRTEAGDTVPLSVANLTTFGSLGTLNASYFAEYYHNGFGVPADVPLDELPADLAARMATGQVFYPGRDFLALGAQIQLSEDMIAAPSAIVSLDDRSRLLSLAVNYSLGDNSDLSLHLFQPVGARGTEFGGRETSAGSGIWAAPGQSLILRLVSFF